MDEAELKEIRAEAAMREFQEENLLERISQLELALEDASWMRLTWNAEREFSREGLQQICELARVMYLKNPLIQRGVNVTRDYVFGQGIGVHAEPDSAQEIVTVFWDEAKNRSELTSLQALGYKEVDLQLNGNIFFVFFDGVTDEGDETVFVRSIPVDEVAEIISDPEDRKTAWFYKRVWVEQSFDPATGGMNARSRTAYYPDWNYPSLKGGANRRWDFDEIQGFPVMWDAPVYHVRVGGTSEMQYGVSEVYAALDWAVAYKNFLEDWATIVRAYSRFAWQLTTTGGKAGIAAAKSRLATTLSGSSEETNPAPTAGSIFIAGEGKKMEPLRTAGATTSADDGRRMLLMVAAVMGIPETFFGDVSVGTLATGKSLDRPTELKMRMRQSLWKDVLESILKYVIGKVEGSKVEGLRVKVTFPPILEHDVAASVTAIVQAATLGNYQVAGVIDEETITRMLLTALGEPDVEGVLEKLAAMRDEQAADSEQQSAVSDQRTAVSDQQPEEDEENLTADESGLQMSTAGTQMNADGMQMEEGMVEAARELREAIGQLVNRLKVEG